MFDWLPGDRKIANKRQVKHGLWNEEMEEAQEECWGWKSAAIELAQAHLKKVDPLLA